jgi:hypothetical protein
MKTRNNALYGSGPQSDTKNVGERLDTASIEFISAISPQ